MNKMVSSLRLCRWAVSFSFLLLVFVVIGCKEQSYPVDSHQSGEHDQDGSDAKPVATIVLSDASQKLQPGIPVTLQFYLKQNDRPIKDLVQLHEKLVHLIAVREGLDQFSHVHPTVDTDGKMTVQVTFPVAGTYFLFADYQQKNGPASLARTQLTIPGDSVRAPTLVPNHSPDVVAENLKARVMVDMATSETKITFQIRDDEGKVVSDLQPYLGAMGHLVVVSADGEQYVHAHPIEDAEASRNGAVAFGAHFQNPGIYKMWGQFQRRDKIITIPFVIDYQTTRREHTGHK